MVVQIRFRFFRLFAVFCLLFVWLGSFSIQAQNKEFRAYWASAFQSGFKTPAQVDKLVDDLRKGHFNAVVVQVRKRGDAYYDGSPYEPKALDVSPIDFDPLGYLIYKAHNTNEGPRIEVHTWLVSFNIWNNQNADPAQPLHPYNLHKDWLTRNSSGTSWDGDNYAFDQGHPDVQRHTYNVAMDIVSRYDVDGINFDYIRYAGPTWGYNPVTVARFNNLFSRTGQPATSDAAWLQFRRDQVTGLVRKIYLNTIAIKPHVKVSCDTITWAPAPTNDSSWTNSARAYTDVLQDWRSWMEEGMIDFNLPMTYFRQHERPQDYIDWCDFIKDHRYNRHAVVGPGSYMNTVSNAIYQMRICRIPTAAGNVADGICNYVYGVPTSESMPVTQFNKLLVETNAYDSVVPPIFADVVETPEMPWKTAPVKGHLKGFVYGGSAETVLDGAVVTISGPDMRFRTNDATGFYGFVDLTPGTYIVETQMRNWGTASAIVTITPGVVSTVDLILPPVDTDAPRIKNVRAENITLQSAEIRWETDEDADSTVEWGNTTAYGDTLTDSILTTTNHYLKVSGLSACTKYHFRVKSKDAVGNEKVSGDYVFSTSPIISNVQAQKITSSTVEISWDTDSPTDSVIEYGLSSAYGNTFTNAAFLRNHRFTLLGLAGCSTYHFRVRAKDAMTNEVVSADYSFSTVPSGTLPDIIVDNGSAGSYGAWSRGTASLDKYGSDYLYKSMGAGDSGVVFAPTIATAGRYRVYEWHPQGGNRTSGAPYIINAADAVQTVLVNQQTNGGSWNYIGTYSFGVGNSNSVTITDGFTDAGMMVMADAIKFVYDNSDANLVVDNDQVAYSGLWSYSTAAPASYGGHYQVANTVSGAATSVATYVPNILVSGKYHVYMWYPQASNLTARAQVTTVYSGGAYLTNVDQRVNGGTWVRVAAAVDIVAGTSAFVQIANDTGESGRMVVADAVRFEIVRAPSFISFPKSQNADVGKSVTFTVEATGEAPLHYQWRFNGVDIPGATGTNYVRSNLQPSDAGSYTVAVSNPICTQVSSAAVLTINYAPAITTQPQSRTVNAGASATFSVAASGTPSLRYQWQFQGVNLAGANGPTLVIPYASPTNNGAYTVTVMNNFGNAFSQTATLTVLPPESPELSGLQLLSDNRFSFSVTGDPGVRVSVDVSTDLVNWSPMMTLLNKNGTVQIVDPSPCDTQRFYRVRWLP